MRTIAAEVGGNLGSSKGKSEYRFNLTDAFGDLAKDRYTVFGTFDYFKRDPMMRPDTEFGHSRDMRGYDGGRNAKSFTGAACLLQFSNNQLQSVVFAFL